MMMLTLQCVWEQSRACRMFHMRTSMSACQACLYRYTKWEWYVTWGSPEWGGRSLTGQVCSSRSLGQVPPHLPHSLK